ncbi:hypothetical protein FACS1894103_6310 [Campylobacterota bacterium]|nr:hypothetical protein FACS1894103_6310 [Campylobacterota bacterium]
MRIFLSLLLVIFAVVAMTGCSAKTAKTAQKPTVQAPDWVVSKSGSYPNSAYLTGLGSGANQNTAADRARSEVIKTIAVTIDSSEQSKVAVSGTTYESSFSNTVYARATQTIEGVEIAERWHDTARDLHYALAVLDKARAAARLRALIAQQDLDIDALFAEAQKSGDQLVRLKLYNDAVVLLNGRKADEAVLSVLADRPAGAYAQANALLSARRETLAALRFAVKAQGAARQFISEALGKSGLTLAPAANADYLLDGSFESSTAKAQDWEWATAVLRVFIVDKTSGAERKTVSFEAREAALTSKAAVERAAKKLQGVLDKELLEKLVQ